MSLDKELKGVSIVDDRTVGTFTEPDINVENLRRFREDWDKKKVLMRNTAITVFTTNTFTSAQIWWSTVTTSDRHVMTTLKLGAKMSYRKLNTNQIEQLYKEFGKKEQSNDNKLKR